MAPHGGLQPEVTGFFDPATSTVSYLVVDGRRRVAAIIDPVLDFEPRSGRITTESADRILAALGDNHLAWILDTHCHADHLSAAPYLKDRRGGSIAIGANIPLVQTTWKAIYNLEPDFPTDGSQFDRLLAEGDRLSIGELALEAWHTPGHTQACMTYIVRGAEGPAAAFVGDTLFMPDYGTARCDFPGGDARQLYRSIQRILSLPPETRLFMCHDYMPGGRPPLFETTVFEERRSNIHLQACADEAAFAAFRRERDKSLSAPALILPAIQVNIRAGHLPPPEANGTVYLKLPVNRL